LILKDNIAVNKYGIKAKELFLQGYNCSQAVVGAFAEELNIDKETLMMMSSSFGGGVGRLREVCGGFSGAIMVAGLKFGYSDPKDVEAKTTHYKLIQDLATEFKAANGKDSIICKEILGVQAGSHVPEARTPEYYKKRPCPDIVAIAAHIIGEKILSEK
jgi:C_GCAxxG_C_C family probable redox protein